MSSGENKHHPIILLVVFQFVSELEQKEDSRLTRSSLMEEVIRIDGGCMDNGTCLSIKKGLEGHPPSDQSRPPSCPPLVLLLAARRAYLAHCLKQAQQVQTVTSRTGIVTNNNATSSSSVLGGVSDIFLHINTRQAVVRALDKMAETYPIAIHWTSHHPSKSSCHIRNTHNTTTPTFLSNHHALHISNSNNEDYNYDTNFLNNNSNNNNNNNNNTYFAQHHSSAKNVDGVVVVYVEGREITCTVFSTTISVVHPNELVHFIRNYYRFV